MSERKFGYFQNSNPLLYQFLLERGIEPDNDLTESVAGSTRLIWYWKCGDELRKSIEAFKTMKSE